MTLSPETLEDIHTCHDGCKQQMCVMRLELEAERGYSSRLREALVRIEDMDSQDDGSKMWLAAAAALDIPRPGDRE